MFMEGLTQRRLEVQHDFRINLIKLRLKAARISSVSRSQSWIAFRRNEPQKLPRLAAIRCQRVPA